MSENTNTQNLNSYYTTVTKVEKPERTVASAPEKLPVQHFFNDKEATEKIRALNTDIYEGAKNEKKKETANVIKYIAGIGIAILGVIGVNYLIKFFRKS